MLVTGPMPLAVGLAALILVVAVFLRPRTGLYLLLFCSLFLEQWGIVGLDPVTARLPFYQTFSGTGGIPLPVSPLEVLLIVTLLAVAAPHIARRGGAFVRGPLFTSLLLFLSFVVLSIAYGAVRSAGVGPFDIRAAWEETRSFFYLGGLYVLVCNLIKTREQLRTFIWLFPWPDGKFRFKPDWPNVPFRSPYRSGPVAEMPPLPDHWTAIEQPDEEHPFRLATSPARGFLNSTFNETPTSIEQERRPTVMIHPDDARAYEIGEGDFVVLGNKRGQVHLHREDSSTGCAAVC